jgi:hypothetical protein
MGRTLTKPKSAAEVFHSGLIDIFKNPNDNTQFSDKYWKIKPVDPIYFAKHFLREPFFPVQAEFVSNMIGIDPYSFSVLYDEGQAYWGKGAGKDMMIAKEITYVAYKLGCLKNPQRFLREVYGASIGDGDAIDLINMSFNARQAQDVFFKKLKVQVFNCINPTTGRNWFEEQGMNVKDQYDIQTNTIKFPYNITAHSLNSESYSGEGLNTFIANVDEFGQFDPKKAFDLLDSIESTVASRYGDVGKVQIFSYKYYNNDPMDILFKKSAGKPKIYQSHKATWQVNPLRTKEHFSKFYMRNPEKAAMMFECKGGEETGGYITKKYMLKKMFDPAYANPIKGHPDSVHGDQINNIEFEDWFYKNNTGKLYAIHVDLATGSKSKNNDCVGIAMVHVESMYAKIDKKLQDDLLKEGINVQITGSATGDSMDVVRKGVVVDLALQVTARLNSEVQMSDIRQFIIQLKRKYKFNILFVSYDGWESRDSVQILRQEGIDAFNFSVDKDNGAYETWKELMYQQLCKCYPNSIAEREAKELIISDKGKVDHPEKSYARELAEGIDNGSKDVMDAIVGAAKTAYEKMGVEPDIFFG